MYIEVARSFTLLGMKFTFSKQLALFFFFFFGLLEMSSSSAFVVCQFAFALCHVQWAWWWWWWHVDFSFRFSRLLNFSFFFFVAVVRSFFSSAFKGRRVWLFTFFIGKMLNVKSVPWDLLSSISLLIGNRRTNSVRELYMAAQQCGLDLIHHRFTLLGWATHTKFKKKRSARLGIITVCFWTCWTEMSVDASGHQVVVQV